MQGMFFILKKKEIPDPLTLPLFALSCVNCRGRAAKWNSRLLVGVLIALYADCSIHVQPKCVRCLSGVHAVFCRFSRQHGPDYSSASTEAII